MSLTFLDSCHLCSGRLSELGPKEAGISQAWRYLGPISTGCWHSRALTGSLSLFLFEQARGLGPLELFCLVGWHRLKFWLSRHIWCHFAEFGEREASVDLTPSPEVDV